MDFQISFDLPPRLPPDAWVAIDLELFGAEKHRLHRPTTGIFASLQICYKSGLVHVITNETLVKPALENIKDAVWIFFNASFDITHLRRWTDIPPRNKLWDTMIIERIMCGGLYDEYSLEALARRRLNIRLDKQIRKTFETSIRLSDAQIHYAAEDALVTLLICEHQKKEITKNDYKIWTTVDREAFWPLLDFMPMRIDVDAWKSLAIENENKANKIKALMTFNPASPMQVKEVLIKNGFKGLKNTQEAAIQRAIEKYPEKKAVAIAQQILEYRTYAKRASTYGQNFLDNYLEQEGENIFSIRAGYWVVGAETGRTSSSSPNFQNIPARDTQDFRKCFIPRPNNRLVIVDMGQQETRIAAYLSQDKTLIEILKDVKQDIFVGMAKTIYKRDIKRDDPFRKKVKNTVYGILYGISPEGMADRYNMSIEEADQSIKDFFHTFHDLYSYIIQQSKKTEYVETVSGRRIWLNPYSDQVERNARNSPIQGTAADQMKIALANIYKKWPVEIPEEPQFCCVGYIHDELIFDVKKEAAEKVAKFVSREMIDAAEKVCLGIPFIAEPKICMDWSEKD